MSAEQRQPLQDTFLEHLRQHKVCSDATNHAEVILNRFGAGALIPGWNTFIQAKAQRLRRIHH